MSCSATLYLLFGVGFALQMGGVYLVVKEIAGDIRAARAIMEREQAPPATTDVLQVMASGRIGGTIGESLERGDSFRRFFAERIQTGVRSRTVGVVLFVVGAVVALAANLLSVGC